MTEEIKINGNSIQIGNKVCYCVDKDLIKYITNLQQENKELNRMCELYSKSLYNAELTVYKSRCEKAIEHLKESLDILKGDSDIPIATGNVRNRYLKPVLNTLNGSDENE